MVDLAKFKNIYTSEVEDKIQILNDNLLILEKKFDVERGVFTEDVDEIFNELMRSAHTIKGSSASMGYNKMAFLTHVLEDVFDAAHNDSIEINSDIINLAFKSIDSLEKSLLSIKDNDQELDFEDLANDLKNITGVNTVGVGKSVRSDDGNPIVQSKQEIKPKDNQEKDNSDDIVNSAISKIDYIKVPIRRLDVLMDLVEELLIDKMRLMRFSHENEELNEISSHIELLVSSIQHEVIQSRLVPVEQVFARFPRMIRDLAHKQKKDIDFSLIGQEIELDRTVIDRLGEPLVHLLRNAVDHGVEDKGSIQLKAIRESEHVLFVVENEGVSIDVEKIKEVAIRKGVASGDVIANMEEEKLLNLIFHPNFSTSDKITEISGRGVGLSVVKGFVESFGGNVSVKRIDSGSRFLLELPLTLAIINSLLVEIGDSIFAVPYSSVLRSVNFNRSDINKMADRDMIVVDGLNVPLVRYEEIFTVNSDGLKLKEENNLMTIVLLKSKNEIIGIEVDKLLDEQEIIVKPFSSVLQGVRGFSGSTILGDGKVVLIMDIDSLLSIINNK